MRGRELPLASSSSRVLVRLAALREAEEDVGAGTCEECDLLDAAAVPWAGLPVLLLLLRLTSCDEKVCCLLDPMSGPCSGLETTAGSLRRRRWLLLPPLPPLFPLPLFPLPPPLLLLLLPLEPVRICWLNEDLGFGFAGLSLSNVLLIAVPRNGEAGEDFRVRKT